MSLFLIIAGLIDCAGSLENPIRKCGFSMVHVRHNAEVPYPLRGKISQIHVLDTAPTLRRVRVGKCAKRNTCQCCQAPPTGAAQSPAHREYHLNDLKMISLI
jgi:hypothetical protein